MAINRIKTGGITDGTIQSGDIAPGTVASDRIAPGTITNDRLAGSIANAKLANSAITINGTAIALGASGEIVAGTDWQAVTVADGSTQLTAEAGKGYFLDTNTGVIEVFLPASPSRGDTVVLIDYAGTFATNNVIVNTGTNNLDSTTTRQYKLTTNDTVAEFVFVDSAKGYITKISQAAGTTPSGVFTDGTYDTDAEYIAATGGTVSTVDTNFKVHVFTGDGCFVVSNAGNAQGSNKIDYLVVAGGGGSGYSQGGGGGGGGYRESAGTDSGSYTRSPLGACVAAITAAAQTYPISVGGGGSGGPSANTNGTAGSNSVFSTITSAGGGYGGYSNPGNSAGGPGGSGGGGGGNGGNSGGNGNTPPVSPPQGNNGGIGWSGQGRGGGGGGATAAGNPSQSTGGPAGAGATSCITGSPVGRAGGGGGGSGASPGGSATDGGAAGKGTGGGSGTAGTANTGGGGGGGAYPNAGAAGGKGIVVLRYKFQN